MKRSVFTYIILFCFCHAVANKIQAQSPLPAGKIITTVACQADATQSYAVYIPITGNQIALPVVYFFDSHGNGALPLAKYKALADEYGFILIGSNNSKNGNDWTAAGNIWQKLFADAQKRLKINTNRMYTCGFSGGAKVAGYVALKFGGIKGVIANGAGLPDGVAAGDFNFSFTALAGEGDMNMAGLVTFTNSLDNTHTRHRTIIFEGKHEWATLTTMSQAFAGLQFDAMLQGTLAKNDTFIANYIADGKKRIDALYTAGHYIKAEQECKYNVAALTGLSNETAWFNSKAASIAGNKLYQKQLQEQQALLAKEQSMQEGYQQQFEQGGMDYWQKTINGLQAAAAAKTAEGMMNQRILAWLSLAFYSISNQLISGNQNDAARHFVDLYKLADATNSEAWYFSAILYARQHQIKATENELLKATTYGFNDKARMRQQPEFKALPINFGTVESKMGGH
jgi:poly(3-hydroxybutyrate) depolymerase